MLVSHILSTAFSPNRNEDGYKDDHGHQACDDLECGSEISFVAYERIIILVPRQAEEQYTAQRMFRRKKE